MKIFKCLNCKRVSKKPNKIVFVECKCGYEMEQVYEHYNPIKLTKLQKEVKK